MLTDIDWLNSYALFVFDCRCYVAILNQLILAQDKEMQFPLCGDANGYAAFVTSSFLQDASVVVYEGINLLVNQGVSIVDLLACCGKDYYSKLKIVRNNMHLYNKYGSYTNKATEIINTQLREFDMEQKDEYYDLRNDIALIYEITENGKKLLGTNYYLYHNREASFVEWMPMEIIEFAHDTAMLLNAISQVDIFTFLEPPTDVLICDPSQIELFDYKSEELFKSLNLKTTTTFRLILILSSLSYTNQLIKSHFNIDAINKSGEWICFATKWIAIKYDEIMDCINNLLQYITTSEKEIIESYLKKYDVDILNMHLRNTAQSLRNMLHYSGNNYKITKSDTGKIDSNIFLMHASRAGIRTWRGFISVQREMINNINKMEDCFRDIFSSTII
jgi:hypothetical protein